MVLATTAMSISLPRQSNCSSTPTNKRSLRPVRRLRERGTDYGSTFDRVAEPGHPLDPYDHRHRLDRRILLFRLAGKQPQPGQPARRPGRRSVGDPWWRHLPPGEVQTGPAKNAGQPALVQMGGLLHLAVGYCPDAGGLLPQPEPVPGQAWCRPGAGTGHCHRLRLDDCGLRGLSLPLRFAPG
ncbi:hypothetical protein D3C84_622140 [compost metagenome]